MELLLAEVERTRGRARGTSGARIWTVGFVMPSRHTKAQLGRRVVLIEIWAETNVCLQMPAALW